MLETVREFALEQLEAHGEADAAFRAHATFCLALVAVAARDKRGAHRGGWLRRIDLEMHNLRSILAWSNAGGHDGEALIHIMERLAYAYWRVRVDANEELRWWSRPSRTRWRNRGRPSVCGCGTPAVGSPPP